MAVGLYNGARFNGEFDMGNGVNKDLQNRIEGTVMKKYEGFEEYLGGVDVEKGFSWDGELSLYITIHVRKDVDIDAFSEKGSGLGVDIHDALGEEYEDLFPYLRLKSFEAESTA